jgi:hypothetical protein
MGNRLLLTGDEKPPEGLVSQNLSTSGGHYRIAALSANNFHNRDTRIQMGYENVLT